MTASASFWIDPQMATLLARLKAMPGIDFRAMPVAEARPLVDAGGIPWTKGAPAMPVQDLSLPFTTHAIPARLYSPGGRGDGPVLVYAHGGGWTFGAIATHDGIMRHLAEASGWRVLGIDYRLSPEHPFPAPLEDVLGAIRFVEDGGLGAPVPAGQIAVAGDSAGANLALGALLARRDAGAARLAAAALFYGCYAPVFDTDSHVRFGDGAFMLTTANMQWYWRNFLTDAPNDPAFHARPLEADLSDLPPLYLSAAGLDPLRDDTMMLAERLARAGVPLRCDHFPGVIHGCLRLVRELDAAKAMIGAGTAFLSAYLNEKTTTGERRSWNAGTGTAGMSSS